MPRPSFFHHLHPVKIPREQARFTYTFGTGGIAVFLSIILGFTGILEMFYYVPTPGQAALSVQTITYLVPLGGFLRNLHFWAGQLLLIITALHFLRVIFTGAYVSPRRFNYLLGAGLFILAIFLDFSGYVLRWDVDIQWALITGTNLIKTIPLLGSVLFKFVVGEYQPGSITLLRFYAWHTYGLVFFSVILVVWHIFRIRRDGGIASPQSEIRQKPVRISRNELVNQEVLAMLYGGAILILLAALVPAPIGAPLTEASLTIGKDQAPWFFLWIQQLLRFGDPFLFGVIIPVSILGILSGIPYIFPKLESQEIGTWFPASGRPAQVATILFMVIILILTLRAL